jgi:type I restriction enzyme R subunit
LFILLDDSRPGATRKIVARNHQVLGVNNAVASVERQEILKREFPPDRRLIPYTIPESEALELVGAGTGADASPSQPQRSDLPLVKRAHPDLGLLGVFWHTQGSGKSYSMAFFAEKVRRTIPGNFTFVLLTDRDELDQQIFRTFVGCGVGDDKTPRARSGEDLEALPGRNHQFILH